MTPAQSVAAALRELLAPTPDHTHARTYISEINAADLARVELALADLADMAGLRQASLRVKAGAR